MRPSSAPDTDSLIRKRSLASGQMVADPSDDCRDRFDEDTRPHRKSRRPPARGQSTAPTWSSVPIDSDTRPHASSRATAQMQFTTHSNRSADRTQMVADPSDEVRCLNRLGHCTRSMRLRVPNREDSGPRMMGRRPFRWGRRSSSTGSWTALEESPTASEGSRTASTESWTAPAESADSSGAVE